MRTIKIFKLLFFKYMKNFTMDTPLNKFCKIIHNHDLFEWAVIKNLRKLRRGYEIDNLC